MLCEEVSWWGELPYILSIFILWVDPLKIMQLEKKCWLIHKFQDPLRGPNAMTERGSIRGESISQPPRPLAEHQWLSSCGHSGISLEKTWHAIPAVMNCIVQGADNSKPIFVSEKWLGPWWTLFGSNGHINRSVLGSQLVLLTFLMIGSRELHSRDNHNSYLPSARHCMIEPPLFTFNVLVL